MSELDGLNEWERGRELEGLNAREGGMGAREGGGRDWLSWMEGLNESERARETD